MIVWFFYIFKMRVAYINSMLNNYGSIVLKFHFDRVSYLEISNTLHFMKTLYPHIDITKMMNSILDRANYRYIECEYFILFIYRKVIRVELSLQFIDKMADKAIEYYIYIKLESFEPLDTYDEIKTCNVYAYNDDVISKRPLHKFRKISPSIITVPL